MNKTQRRKERLEKHYATLEKLSEFLDKKQDGKTLSLKLWALEKRGNRLATDYCNGTNGMNENKWVFEATHLKIAVEKVFGTYFILGLIINGDARGYAIKIDSDFMETYKGIDLHRDWGGNGILSPEINGEA